MKKIMILVAALGLLMACGGNSGKTVEQQAVEYSEKAYEAMLEQDFQKLMEIAEETEKWYESLSEEDKAKADKAGEEWEAKNADKLEKLQF